MRCWRGRMSWVVSLIAWPRGSAPVALGGGVTMQYGSPGSGGLAGKNILLHPHPVGFRFHHGGVVILGQFTRHGRLRFLRDQCVLEAGILRGWGLPDNQPANPIVRRPGGIGVSS